MSLTSRHVFAACVACCTLLAAPVAVAQTDPGVPKEDAKPDEPPAAQGEPQAPEGDAAQTPAKGDAAQATPKGDLSPDSTDDVAAAAGAEPDAAPKEEEFTTLSVWKHWKSWNHLGGDTWDVLGAGALFLDTQRFNADDDVEAAVGDHTPFETGEIRGLRLGFVANYGEDRANRWQILFFAAFRGFDRGFEREATDSWTIYDLALTVPVLQYGRLKVGKLKGMSSMERMISGFSNPYMERTSFNDALLPSREIGVTYTDAFLNLRMTLGVSFSNDFPERSGDFDDRSSNSAARATFLPVAGDAPGDLLVHVGVHGRYSNAKSSLDRNGNPVGRIARRPEVEFAPVYLDTGALELDWLAWYGAEVYITYGPFLFGTEWLLTQANLATSGADHPVFHGGSVQASWLLTGETRPYDRSRGLLGAIAPKSPVYGGGYGAVELAVRASYLDLVDGDVNGGRLFRLTPALIWRATRHIRVDINYGFIHLDRSDADGDTHVAQARVILAF